MRNRHRVVWTKGMFLTPQQFQTQDQFFEDALQFRFAASQFANWGVTGLDIDSEALGNGLFRLARCTGIMPDGEPFDMPDTDELPASRSVTEHFPPTQLSEQQSVPAVHASPDIAHVVSAEMQPDFGSQTPEQQSGPP